MPAQFRVSPGGGFALRDCLGFRASDFVLHAVAAFVGLAPGAGRARMADMKSFQVKTRRRTEFVDVTAEVQEAVAALGRREGTATVFVPHTTAGVTINEHADPDVAGDLERALDRMVPWDHPDYRHAEGNTAAHLKTSLLGSSVAVPVEAGRLRLGTWQGVFIAEFDGPRTRTVWVT
jgi:secondary thiamine-phosphate synthase enzyme